MKEKGTLVSIDALGRLVVPSGIRKSLSITPETPLELYMENESIVIRRHFDGCVFCGSSELVTTFLDKPICRACIDKLSEI